MNTVDKIIELCEESDKEIQSDLRLVISLLVKEKENVDNIIKYILGDRVFAKYIKDNVSSSTGSTQRDELRKWIKDGEWKKLSESSTYTTRSREVKNNLSGNMLFKSGPAFPFTEEDDPNEIDNEEDLKQYATKLGQKAFGDKFDKGRMEKMVKDLMSKYTESGKPDFPTIVGVIQQSFD